MSLPEFLADTGISYRQYDHWIRAGWLATEGKRRPGSGNQRTHTAAQKRQALAMAELVKAGMQPSYAARVAKQLAAHDSTRRDTKHLHVTYEFKEPTCVTPASDSASTSPGNSPPNPGSTHPTPTTAACPPTSATLTPS